MVQTEVECRSIIRMIHDIVKALVDDPLQVMVQAHISEECLVMHVKVARGDVGKVIGKQGRTVRSLRTILSAVSMKTKVRCELNIFEYEREEGKVSDDSSRAHGVVQGAGN